MIKYLIPEEGSFYKANLHCHTTISDGKQTPEEVKEFYKANGYSVVAYTDHDVMIPHPDLNDSEFLTLNGFEMEIGRHDHYPPGKPKRTCHFCSIAATPEMTRQPCWNPEYADIGNAAKHIDLVDKDESAPYYTRSYNIDTINEMMQICRDAGFFVTYNHPVWSFEDYPIYTAYHGMHAMEIENYSSARLGYDEHNASKYDDMLRCGERIFAVGADDNHGRNDSLGAFVMIKAPKLEYTAITDALFKGDFYASTGPEIKSLYLKGKTLCVSTSDAACISIMAGVRRARAKYPAEGESLNFASFDLDGSEVYVRVTVTDKFGKNAYSRAYFIDEIFTEGSAN